MCWCITELLDMSMVQPKIKLESCLESLSPLARWKLIILEYGIDCDDDLFSGFSNVGELKTKFKYKTPTVCEKKFFDSSKKTTLVPSELFLVSGKNKTLVKMNYKVDSPFKIISSKQKLALIEKKKGEEVEIKIEPVFRNKYVDKKYKGYSLEEYVQILGQDRLGILAYEGCYHWNIGVQCRFCDSNPRRDWENQAPLSVNSLADYRTIGLWWQSKKDDYLRGINYTLKYIFENENIGPHRHLQLMAGNLPSPEAVWKIFGEIAKEINKVGNLREYDSYMNCLAPRQSSRTELLEEAHCSWGFNQIQINLEVIGEQAFKRVCPGKFSLCGYKNSLDTLKEAVKIFGWGKARSNFVLGAQPQQDLLRGIEEIAQEGVVADFSVFIPKKFTPWEDRKSPSVKEIIIFTQSLAKIYKKNHFQPIYCRLSSRSNILHEVLENI